MQLLRQKIEPSPRRVVGLTTSMIPHTRGGFDLEFDFLDSVLRLRTSWGPQAGIAPGPPRPQRHEGRVHGPTCPAHNRHAWIPVTRIALAPSAYSSSSGAHR